MDPYSGRTYGQAEIGFLPGDVRGRLVYVEGPAESIGRLAKAARHYDRTLAKRRAAAKRARVARRKSR